ncbi:hypothetical protein [Pseudodesulfovibrio senegalensis]|jgi:hypothetical protein|uniref:Uncharacterized protein n=1 Tax=Pseudodesulfovibrio senegalensis TaxID=1721087 RepID=A0A6N6N2T0_9BACT|nr:hypothetical protein [Pseudodesulfovibrio senegalensis]KAB1440852.1 hypothetical protein F8A88_12950 [Pseudodesulfovibrio senegalensis]
MKMKKSAGGDMDQNVSLANDFGDDITFSGHLVGEEMYFNDDTGMLTMEKLYKDDNESLAYSIISAIGHARERRSYSVIPGETTCRVDNGTLQLDLDTEMLFELLTLAIESEQGKSSTVYDHVRRKLAANE